MKSETTHFNCTYVFRYPQSATLTKISWDFCFFYFALALVKVSNPTSFLPHHQPLPSASLRFCGREDFTLRKTALFPLLHAVHTRCLVVFFVAIKMDKLSVHYSERVRVGRTINTTWVCIKPVRPRQTRKNAVKSAANEDVFKIYRRTCEVSLGSSPPPP